jgi:hypothetical protein
MIAQTVNERIGQTSHGDGNGQDTEQRGQDIELFNDGREPGYEHCHGDQRLASVGPHLVCQQRDAGQNEQKERQR